MNNLFILVFMLFMHVIADYNMQGCLANIKQKSWWIDQCEQLNVGFAKYKNDYKMALFMHSFSWSFMIMLPLFITNGFNLSWFGLFGLAFNTVVHYFVDDFKANDYMINLVQDQTYHIIQIVATFVCWNLFV